MKNVSFFLLALVFMAGCSSSDVRVMPGQKGMIKVVSKDADKSEAETSAFKAAKNHCEDQNKKMVVLKESSQYEGTMHEGTRNIIKGASTAAWMTGATNSAAHDASTVGDSMTSGKDYVATIIFKCN